MKKNIVLYTLIISAFTILIWVILEKGKELIPEKNQVLTTQVTPNGNTIIGDDSFLLQLNNNIKHGFNFKQ